MSYRTLRRNGLTGECDSEWISQLMKTTENIFTPYFGDNLNFRSNSDFQESEDNFFIEICMPGFSKKELDLKVKDDILSLKAERKDKAGEKVAVFKQYRLPRESDQTKLNASLDKGILLIEIPKLEKAKSFSITID